MTNAELAGEYPVGNTVYLDKYAGVGFEIVGHGSRGLRVRNQRLDVEFTVSDLSWISSVKTADQVAAETSVAA